MRLRLIFPCARSVVRQEEISESLFVVVKVIVTASGRIGHRPLIIVLAALRVVVIIIRLDLVSGKMFGGQRHSFFTVHLVINFTAIRLFRAFSFLRRRGRASFLLRIVPVTVIAIDSPLSLTFFRNLGRLPPGSIVVFFQRGFVTRGGKRIPIKAQIIKHLDALLSDPSLLAIKTLGSLPALVTDPGAKRWVFRPFLRDIEMTESLLVFDQIMETCQPRGIMSVPTKAYVVQEFAAIFVHVGSSSGCHEAIMTTLFLDP